MCKGFSTLEFPHNLYSQKTWFWVIFRAKQKIWWLTLTKLTNRRNYCAKLSVRILVDGMMVLSRICFSTSNCKPAVIFGQMKSLKNDNFVLCFSPSHFELQIRSVHGTSFPQAFGKSWCIHQRPCLLIFMKN